MLKIRDWIDWWDDLSSVNDSKDYVVESSPSSAQSQSSSATLTRTARLLLDVRTNEEYRTRHFASSESIIVVHIPLADLVDRRFELPPRHVAFGILISTLISASSSRDDDDDSIVPESVEPQQATLLLRLQEMLSGGSSSSNSSSSHTRKDGAHQEETNSKRLTCPWNVTAVLLSVDETWKHAQSCGVMVVQGGALVVQPSAFPTTPFQPEPRLWQPDCMVEHVLLPLLQAQPWNTVPLPDHPPWQIWDLGAGVGRDVCFLAEELLRSMHPNFCVVGLDQRYRDDNNNEAVDFWKRRHVDAVTACKCIDLNNTATLMEELLCHPNNNDNGSAIKCLYAVRYWNRPLFQAVVEAGDNNLLSTGTIVAISQFGKPQPDAPWNFPHPKEKHVLERNALNDLFSSAKSGENYSATTSRRSWNILHDEVVLDSDHGRTLIQFVAQLQE